MSRTPKYAVAVLGAGSWGTTLASALSRKGHEVVLWEFDSNAAARLNTYRRLPVLPQLTVPASLRITSDMAAAMRGRDVIVASPPSHFMRSTMAEARRSGPLRRGALVVSVAKGLEERTLKRMSQVIREELGCPADRIVALSGPSHAEEVSLEVPTAMVAAGMSRAAVSRTLDLFHAPYFRLYPSEDLVGVELAGSIKNIFASACGVSDGLGLGDNTRAAILTRGLNEMTRIGVRMGADLLTFFGLAGMGDLIVTCLSRHSRNRTLGEKIGRGKSPRQALAEMTMVAEGVKTAAAAFRLCRKLDLDCPLTREIYHVLYNGKNPKRSLRDLMKRQTLTEWQRLGALQRRNA